MKYYICKRLRMLEYLRKKGFVPQRTMPDINNPKFNVWQFEYTSDLEQAIRIYFAEIKASNF